jgi:hypothetical protein
MNESPSNFRNIVFLKELKDNANFYTKDIKHRDEQLEEKISRVSSMFDNFQTPVGTIPIGFQELVSLFPFIVSILLLLFAYKVEDLMSSKLTEIDSDSASLRLIYNPYKEKKSQKLKISLLFIPIIVFVFSFVLIILIYFTFDEPSTDRDDPFRAAIDFNKLISVIMSVIGFIFMALALRKLFLNPRISPRVVTTSPSKSSDVSVAETISVVFDTAMDESTLVHQSTVYQIDLQLV